MSVDVSVWLPLGAFWLLFGATHAQKKPRQALARKPIADWALDLIGLAIQGWLVPLLQVVVIFAALKVYKPVLRGIWDLEGWQAFLLNFVVIDYLYYWNHRLLHSRALWPLHRVHHSLTAMDVLGTSRNTIYSSFFILYLWVNAVVLFALTDPFPFALAAALTAALDLWRHSSVMFARASIGHRILSAVFITPHEHAWHHSLERFDVNFGANLSLWDRVHGTWKPSILEGPSQLGVDDSLGFGRRLIFPFAWKTPKVLRDDDARSV